jgi:serine/threonine protein kinase
MVKARNYFAAPEILENGTSADSPKRDLWSLGVMTYFFFTAKFPVFHENG